MNNQPSTHSPSRKNRSSTLVRLVAPVAALSLLSGCGKWIGGSDTPNTAPVDPKANNTAAATAVVFGSQTDRDIAAMNSNLLAIATAGVNHHREIVASFQQSTLTMSNTLVGVVRSEGDRVDQRLKSLETRVSRVEEGTQEVIKNLPLVIEPRTEVIDEVIGNDKAYTAIYRVKVNGKSYFLRATALDTTGNHEYYTLHRTIGDARSNTAGSEVLSRRKWANQLRLFREQYLNGTDKTVREGRAPNSDFADRILRAERRL